MVLIIVSCKNKSTFEVSENKIEAGIHKVEEVKVSVFRLKNVGTESIEVSEIHTECTCTKTSFNKKTIEPDSFLTIKVYNSDNFPGFYQSIITVNSDALNSPNTLILQGKKEM